MIRDGVSSVAFQRICLVVRIAFYPFFQIYSPPPSLTSGLPRLPLRSSSLRVFFSTGLQPFSPLLSMENAPPLFYYPAIPRRLHPPGSPLPSAAYFALEKVEVVLQTLQTVLLLSITWLLDPITHMAQPNTSYQLHVVCAYDTTNSIFLPLLITADWTYESTYNGATTPASNYF